MRARQESRRETIRSAAQAMALVAAVVALVVVALGQGRPHAAPAAENAKENAKVVRGTVVSASQAAIEVRDDRGLMHRMTVDTTTLVLTDDEDFSVANLPDIQLAARDLSAGDRVEVVVRPDGTRSLAGIVTRLSPIGATATARATPHR
jgi:hypothetical protein